jgi:membrane-associated protease RseP (regulator of RpoE activity)
VSGALAVAGLARSGVDAPALSEPPSPEPASAVPHGWGSAAALTEQAAPGTGSPPPSVPAPDPVLARLDEVSASWTRIEGEVTGLRRRVADLEQRMAAVQVKSETTDTSGPRRLSATPDGQRTAMVQAGLAEDVAAEIIRRQGQQSLDRLNLRDVAAREGWLATDRYREELRRAEEDAVDLRQELGDEIYDRYLFAAGEDNRVRVDGIIPGSVGELAGLQPGDLIESYAGEPVLTFTDLRDATTGGERGELVQVRVRRGVQIFDAWVSRGPLGVQLDSARAEPR